MKRALIKSAIYVACALFLIVTIVSYALPFVDPIKYLSTISSIAYFLILIYCKWGWRIHIGKICLSSTPDLNGKWTVVIRYKNSLGNILEKTCHAQIKQDLFGIQVNLKTNEILSHSICAEIVKDHEIQCLYYTYITDPSVECRKNNPSQFGTAKIEILGLDFKCSDKSDKTAKKRVQKMEGDYWTNAQTSGRLIFEKQVKRKD